MITREAMKGDAASSALYSECEQYRYALTRCWDTGGKRLLYIMLNPSKATEQANDPTIERCERRARALGYGAFRACNIFSWRETDPAALKRAVEPIGPKNDSVLLESCNWADDILCAWGAHGDHMERGQDVGRLLAETGRPLLCLGETRAGHPRHPLYIGYGTRPTPWPARL
ncbi:DUF1643 domain-containing protein [Tropicimonas sp. TH_r6]|uniref:DUF1643 domain-containing protein n=1 Tax=Tropicimonas sp. TH_r6 TaxID=3082085 RepID=UPI0029542154|nr:DUF1643 domain-containing protein [Tropicimonas sp. TH_r6]MDV7144061.1 DUF1643 domain-containing protein [Tropicimonas sp. TH_r6]